jgi:hypothetical protein
MAIWNISWRFGIVYDHLVHFVFIWNIFSGFGIMHQEKSGNPDGSLEKPSMMNLALCPYMSRIDLQEKPILHLGNSTF